MGTSYAQAGRKKRQKTLASGAQVPKHRSSKDTKRWCKGIEGREHRWTFEEWRAARGCNPVITARVCAACRKQAELIGGFFRRSCKALGPAY